MKETILEYTTSLYQEEVSRKVLLENKMRLNAFFSEQKMVQKEGDKLIYRYIFYSVEKPKRMTTQYLLKEYKKLPSDLTSYQPKPIQNMECQDIIVYGNDASDGTQKRLAEFLQLNPSLKVQLSFFEKEADSKQSKGNTAYEELQKAIFFCKRKQYTLLFVSVQEMIQDICFLNLLEESHINFRCIDFPWFCKENLSLIKAVMLYKKLQTPPLPRSEAL